MAMEITGSYSNYAASYTSDDITKTSQTQQNEVQETVTRKTASEELSYLSSKYKNYSFVSKNYTQGMRYGSSSTVNVAISSEFLSKMANNPELEAEYEKEIANMKSCDESFVAGQNARGWNVVAQGWMIDKDGGISRWSITQKNSNEKSYLQRFSENADKIRSNAMEKRAEEKEKIEKRREKQLERNKLLNVSRIDLKL